MDAAAVLEWPMVGRGADLGRIVALLERPEVRLVHLVGEAGCGKSRLAAEVLRAAELDGYPVAAVTASASAATVPLSGLSPLLPEQRPDDTPVAVFDRAVAHVRDLADGSRLVLAVDDIDALDTVSCALLGRLLDEGLVVVVATQRAGTRTPDVVLTQHRAGLGVRVDLDDLPRTSVATLLHRALRAPVAAAAEHQLWTTTAGNPLFLRELVTQAVGSGRLAQADGVWVLDGALDVPGGLAGIVADRLGHLDDQARGVVDLLALCAPLGADELAETCPLELLEQLEADGVITVVPEGRRQQVRLAHPLYAQVVREAMPRLRLRRLLLDQVARVQAHGARRRDDPLRMAVWQLDATGTADPTQLVVAARLARAAHDYPLVERLARAAIVLEPDLRASSLLGEALYEQGRSQESEEVLTAALAAASPDAAVPVDTLAVDELTRLGLLHAITLFFGLGRLSEALERLAITPVVADGDGAAAVASMTALILTQAGRSREALEVLPAEPPADAGMRAVHDRAKAWALHRTGDSAAAAALALGAWERETTGEPIDSLLHPAGHLVVAALAQLECGEPAAARASAALGRDHAIAEGVHFQAAWLAWAVATIELVTGFAEDAAGAFTELAATTHRQGFAQVERMAALGMTEACALRGDAAQSALWLSRADDLQQAPPAYAPAEAVARAWAAAVSGDRAGGAASLRGHAEELAARGELRDAVMLADEVVLFGDTSIVDWLLGLLDEIDTPVSRARRARAVAARSGRPDDLLEAAEAFAECGFVHSAAVLCVEAALTLRADGQARAASAAEVRGRGYAERSPGLVISGLAETSTPVGLTPREREIAELASRARTSKDIAAALVLSVRTVDNHLSNVYVKLGVTSRGELAGALSGSATVPAQQRGSSR